MTVKAVYTTEDNVTGNVEILLQIDDNTPIKDLWSMAYNHKFGLPYSKLLRIEILRCDKLNLDSATYSRCIKCDSSVCVNNKWSCAHPSAINKPELIPDNVVCKLFTETSLS